MVNNIGSRWYENTYVPWHRFHFVLFHIDYIQPVYQPKLYDTANDTAKPESPTPTPYFPPEMRGSTCDNFITNNVANRTKQISNEQQFIVIGQYKTH